MMTRVGSAAPALARVLGQITRRAPDRLHGNVQAPRGLLATGKKLVLLQSTTFCEVFHRLAFFDLYFTF